MKIIMQVMIMTFLIFLMAISTSAEASKEIELSNGEVVKVSFMDKHNGYRYEVKFENGHKYFYERSDNTGTGGSSLELTDIEMSLAEEAIDKYEHEYGFSTISTSNNSSSGNPMGIIFILIGLFGAVFPYAAWYLEIGWKLHEAEPSEIALFANRAIGIIIFIVGLSILI